MLNNMKLEEQKKQKAEEILKKHSDITAKNKIYKEKKDQILQAIKKVNPEIWFLWIFVYLSGIWDSLWLIKGLSIFYLEVNW